MGKGCGKKKFKSTRVRRPVYQRDGKVNRTWKGGAATDTGKTQSNNQEKNTAPTVDSGRSSQENTKREGKPYTIGGKKTYIGESRRSTLLVERGKSIRECEKP